MVQTTLAATKRSVAFLVVTVPLLLVALLPVAAALTSTGLTVINATIFQNANVRIVGCGIESHRDGVRAGRARRNVLGVINRL